jgi:hypothetical protein
MDPAVVKSAPIQVFFGSKCSSFNRIKGGAALRGRATTLALASILMAACSSSGGSYQVVRQIDDELFGVACANTSHCIAVGQSGNPAGGNGSHTLILESAGSGWAIVPSPDPTAATSSFLRGVTCTGSTRCIAVGSYQVGTSGSQTLIEENTGSGWAIVSSPNPADFDRAFLSGVTCASASYCIAVGGYEASNGGVTTLVEESTGVGWTILPSPATKNGDYLYRAACTGARRCIGVGSASQSVIEENTGKGWTVVPFEGASDLADVSCGNPTHCVIVGYSGTFGNERPVILESAGSGWVNTPAARPDGSLYGVTCTSAAECIAVGSVGGGESVIEQRTPSGWILLPRLMLDTSEPSYLATVDLESVACAGAAHCVIVGVQYIGTTANATGQGKNLIAENTGGGWAVVSSPDIVPSG